MTRKLQEMRVLGRNQRGRPAAPDEAHQQVDSERGLTGALSVPIEQIAPDPGQPRSAMDPQRLQELAASIAAEGLLQPIVVREAGFRDDGRTHYVIVAGARRHAAAQQAGLTRVPVLVRESDGASLRVLQLTENLHREDLSEVDEGRAYQELMDLESLSPRGVAERLHISDQQVRDRLRLAADQVLADAVSGGQIAASTAREILKQPDALREEFRARVAAGERLQGSDLTRARDQLRADGQQPPRRNPGSGRKRISQTVFEKSAQTLFEKPAPAVPDQTPSPACSPLQSDQMGIESTPRIETTSGGPARGEMDRAPDTARAQTIAPPEPAEAAVRRVDLSSSSMMLGRPVSDAALLPALVDAAGGKQAVLALLHWAIGRDLSLAELIQAVTALPERSEG